MLKPLIAILLPLAFLAPTAAEACQPTTSTAHAEVAGVYVFVGCLSDEWDDQMECQWFGPWGTTWIYQESNGIPGLQRNDDFHDDTCGGQITADTILY